MGVSPFAHGLDRAGYRFVSRASSDYRLCRPLSRAEEPRDRCPERWDDEEARRSLREQVVKHVACPDGVLVLDESEFARENGKFVGAHRIRGSQGSPTHMQTGIFLAYCGSRGRGYLDRELYLPKSWVDHRDLRAASGVPGDVRFITRPEMAQRMLQRALEHDLPHRFVAGGPTFGADPGLRRWLSARREAYVLGIPDDQTVTIEGRMIAAGYAAASLPGQSWRAGDQGGASPPWAAVKLDAVRGDARGARGFEGWERWLIACRQPNSDTVMCYLGNARANTDPADLAEAVGAYQRVRTGLREAREAVGLDRFAGRSWEGWYRHMTVALMAHTVLCLARDGGRTLYGGDHGAYH